MFNGKKKAVTFSYDDGVSQDIRLMELFNKYGLKGTFNINSGLTGRNGTLEREGTTVTHYRIAASDLQRVYDGHEVAVHGVTHPNLNKLTKKAIVREVEGDRLRLSEAVGYEVVGMAYPGCSGNARVYDIVRNYTGVQYARKTKTTHTFEVQTDLIEFEGSVYHHREWDEMERLADEFLASDSDRPQIFYIWGHSYEFDIHGDWERMEAFCKKIGGRDDIFYGTNKEVLLDRDIYTPEVKTDFPVQRTVMQRIREKFSR